MRERRGVATAHTRSFDLREQFGVEGARGCVAMLDLRAVFLTLPDLREQHVDQLDGERRRQRAEAVDEHCGSGRRARGGQEVAQLFTAVQLPLNLTHAFER